MRIFGLAYSVEALHRDLANSPQPTINCSSRRQKVPEARRTATVSPMSPSESAGAGVRPTDSPKRHADGSSGADPYGGTIGGPSAGRS